MRILFINQTGNPAKMFGINLNRKRMHFSRSAPPGVYYVVVEGIGTAQRTINLKINHCPTFAVPETEGLLTTAKAFAVEVSPNPFSSNTNFKITGAKMRSGYFHYPTLTERLFIKIKTTTLRKQ